MKKKKEVKNKIREEMEGGIRRERTRRQSCCAWRVTYIYDIIY